MSNPHDTPALDSFQADIAKLRAAADLLEEIWNVTGPYTIPDRKTWLALSSKLQKHFDFDDSE